MHENLVILSGYLIDNPQYYEGTKGQDTIGRCTFQLMVITTTRGKQYTMKVNLIAWGALASHVMKHYIKGDYLATRGFLNVRPKPRSNGSTKWITEIIMETIFSEGA